MARDLASVLLEIASGPWATALVSGAVLTSLALGLFLLTSTVLRRPGVPADPTVVGRPRSRRSQREARAEGARDASAMRFGDWREVVDTLGRVSLAQVSVAEEATRLLLAVPATASSRGAWSRKPMCAWEIGFLEGGLRRFAAGDVRVKEIECAAAGGASCRFEVALRNPLR